MPVPLYHCFGMVIGSLQMVTNGATCIFPSPGFDAGKTLQAVSDERLVHLIFNASVFKVYPHSLREWYIVINLFIHLSEIFVTVDGLISKLVCGFIFMRHMLKTIYLLSSKLPVHVGVYLQQCVQLPVVFTASLS